MAKTQWKLDASHSEVLFKIRHMMISTVTGKFDTIDAEVMTDGDDFTDADIRFTADIGSISTNNSQRDEHLRSADFFDASNHPEILFESTSFKPVKGDVYQLEGNLTIRGIRKPVSFKVEYGGTIKDMYGLTRSGFSVEGSINRKDFGLNWSALTEAGGLVVSDEVKISANVEFTKA